MIKIFLTVRNRLGITMKCIRALEKHTTVPYQLYVYDNQTNHMLDDHFKYFNKLFKRGSITQVTFNTDASTFNAFSKATSCNMFGLQHEQDPQKSKCEFLLMMDNDIIVTPKWNEHLTTAWNYVHKKKLNHVKVVGQLPGGIKSKKETHQISKDMIGKVGMLGGSGFWSVRSNFFTDVGFLPLPQLVGHNKKHDQLYWQLLAKASKRRPYIMGVNQKLGIHCGSMAGSVCNSLTRRKNKVEALEHIKFEKADQNIKNMTFESFFKMIDNDQCLKSDW